jgi:hypothetical protein
MPFDMRRFSTLRQVIPHQATFFGSGLFHQLGGYDEEFGIAADQVFIFDASRIREPVTVPRVLCDFDTTGAGSVRPMRENFNDMRRLWDMRGFYPLGSRRKSLVYLRCREIATRSLLATASIVGKARSRLNRRSRA